MWHAIRVAFVTVRTDACTNRTMWFRYWRLFQFREEYRLKLYAVNVGSVLL